jgi:hypothetical protein
MTKRVTTKTDKKKGTSASVPNSLKQVPRKKAPIGDLVVQQRSAFLTHIDDSNLAIPANKWIDDPETSRVVPTYSFVNAAQCVDTNRIDVARSRLAYVGTFSGTQCQQDADPSHWVLARRLT